MIDLQKLEERKEAFGFFAQQLAYPEQTVAQSPDVKDVFSFSPQIQSIITQYLERMQQLRADELEELYVQTFDFQKKSTLYMTYFKFEDSKERGQTLAKLKSIYELYGLEMANSELSDYLPLMCEFIYAAQWGGNKRAEESFSLMLAVLEDGTHHLLKALDSYESPYFPLIKALRETFKSCLRLEVQEVRGHG